jgi:hypothetical protein
MNRLHDPPAKLEERQTGETFETEEYVFDVKVNGLKLDSINIVEHKLVYMIRGMYDTLDNPTRDFLEHQEELRQEYKEEAA